MGMNWRPCIYRAWSNHDGRFYWTCTRPRANTWTGATLHHARAMERAALDFARRLNAKEIGK